MSGLLTTSAPDLEEWSSDSLRDLVAPFDDRLRRAYLALFGFGFVGALAALWVLDVRLFSLLGVLLVPVLFIVFLIAGRFLGLSKFEARVRRDVLACFEQRRVEVESVVTRAQETRRFPFFTGLFVGPRRVRPSRSP